MGLSLMSTMTSDKIIGTYNAELFLAFREAYRLAKLNGVRMRVTIHRQGGVYAYLVRERPRVRVTTL